MKSKTNNHTHAKRTGEVSDKKSVCCNDDLREAFNIFIKKWCGNHYPHLIDTDENDGEDFRQLLDSKESEILRLTRELEYARRLNKPLIKHIERLKKEKVRK